MSGSGTIIILLLFGFFISLFYKVLLASHGLNFKYKYLALIITGTLIILNLLSRDIALIAILILFIGIFILAIAMFIQAIVPGSSVRKKTLGKTSKLTSENKHDILTDENEQAVQKVSLANYSGFIFHVIIVILLALSMFTYNPERFLSKMQIENLIIDVYFQFTTGVFFLIIGIINPFLNIKPQHIAFFDKLAENKYLSFLQCLKDPFKWKLFKFLLCFLILGILYLKGFFILPNLNGSLTSNLALFFIASFFLYNLIFLLKNPQEFRAKNLSRVVLLYKAGYASIFVAAICVFSTIILSAAIGINIDKLQVTSESTLLLGFNIVMAYVEFKLANNQV